MAKPTAAQTLQRAIQHHQAGRLPEAEALYREVLAREPNSADALHLLGVIEHQRGRYEQAVRLISRAATRAPTNPAIHSNLGEAYRHLGQLDEAVACFRRALARQPNYPEALNNLGSALSAQGQLDEAVACFQQALALNPKLASAHYNLGALCKNLGRLDEALAAYRQALVLNPNFAEAHNNLGLVFKDRGQPDEALACCQRALALKPDYLEALSNLGILCHGRGKFDDAIACYRRTLVLRPDLAEAHNNLGGVYIDLGRLDEAVMRCQQALVLKPDLSNAHNDLGNISSTRGQLDRANASFRRALALKPDFAEAYNNLGNLCKDRSEHDAALVCYRQALALKPDNPVFHSNLVLALQYRSDAESGALDRELLRWSDRHARPVARFIQAHHHDCARDRPLRVGYFSHDFKLHSVAFFLLPLLEAHDRGQFHLTGYSTNPRADEVTARLRACTDQWRSLVGLSDDAAAQAIRDDRIDLLIDLSGHTAGNRLLVFARKPAPIQVSYLGFPGRTGLATIDCRLTDPWADPPGASDGPPADPLVRLPETAWCFTPLSGQPPVSALPALRNGCVTFGCFNNFAKVTDEMLELWAQILHQVPHARLALKNSALGSPSIVRRLQTFFNERGVATARLEFILPQAAIAEHLQCYDRVDLALDTFPYHGTTTTCEALWMGVPVVTLAGHRHVARVGVSLLTNVGLPEFIAPNPAAYLDTAVAAARDLPRLAALRAGLRERMQRSPLMDAPRFARAIEAAYRTLWHRWCAQPASAAALTR